jgi:hypothetical protein
MSVELEVLKLVCHRLDQAGISYMLTGSFAANFYAIPRMTRDIDIVVELPKLDIDKFFEAFESDFYIDKETIDEAIRHQGMFNIIHNESVFKIDFIIRKDTSYRHAEFIRKQQIKLNNNLIWIVAPEDLIISKLWWAKDSMSDMQLNDVKNLLLTIKNLDKNYIDQWVQNLDLNSVYEKVKNHG